MSDVMELEARLKNLISGEMKNIVKSIEDVTKKSEDSSKKQKVANEVVVGSVDKMADSWNIAKIAATSFISAMGAMAILNTVKNQLIGIRNETKEYIQLQLQQKVALGFTSSALNAQSEALMKLYTISDDIITRVQTTIAFFTKDEDQIKRLTKATLDFSAATGMDATSASMLLGRSIENGGALLSRYGLKIKETSNEMERAEFIIDAVNNKFDGQALALAQSRDMWDKLKITVEETQEALGLLFNSKFWKGGMSTKDSEYIAFMEYNYKNSKRILSESENYSEEVLARAKARIQEYESDQAINEKRSAQYKNYMSTYFDELKKSNLFTEKLQNELLERTAEGKIKSLEKQMNVELNNKKLTEEQKLVITEIYASKISEIQDQINKKNKDYFENELNYVNRMYELDLKKRNDILKLTYEAFEADIKANNEQAERQERNISIIMQRKFKANEQDKKDKDDQKKKDDELRKNKIENIQFGEEAVFSSLKNIARATKANSGVQKTLDIAQATASTALAVTKAMAPGLKWQIPFIIAMGATQIALIASQKYQYGGIVPGNKPNGDQVPAMMNSGEMVLTLGQQGNLFNLLSRPNQISNSTSNQNSTNNNSAINLHINVGNNGNYDMNAARYTVDSLVPLLGDALVKAKNEGRLRSYESAR